MNALPTLDRCAAVLIDDGGTSEVTDLSTLLDGAAADAVEVTPLAELASVDHGLRTPEGTAMAVGCEAAAITVEALMAAVGARVDWTTLDLPAMAADALDIWYGANPTSGCEYVTLADATEDDDGAAAQRLYDWSDAMVAESSGAGFVVETSADCGMTWFYLPGRTLDLATYLDAVTFLALSPGGGRVPCSRYGADSESVADWAAAFALCIADATGEPVTVRSLDYAMSLAVNDSDDIADMIADYGAGHALDAAGTRFRVVDYGAASPESPDLVVFFANEDDPGAGPTPEYVEAFTTAFITCALWATTYTPRWSHDERRDGAGCSWCGAFAMVDRDGLCAECYADEYGAEPTPCALTEDFTADDLAPEAVEEIATDCAYFVRSNWSDLRALDAEQSGHDFLLTREGHGAGFWDRGLGEVGDRLTRAAKAYGSLDLYPGDDGRLHV